MQSLLRWSIENSAPNSSATTQPMKAVDSGLIDYILGPSPAQQMEDALGVATDYTIEEGGDEDDDDESTGSKATRMQALANVEMLVQDIDNAKHLTNKNMKMWKQLQELLTSPKSSPNIIKQTLWVIGTAIQNSPEAQNACLEITPIPAILSYLGANNSSKIRSKAMYALSALLKHNKAAVNVFGAAGGWDVLRTVFSDPLITIRRKVSFLINLLLMPATDIRPLDIQVGPGLHTPAALDTSTSPLPSPSPAPIVHPNSHASMVSDPSSVNTSPIALKAMREHKLLDSVITTLVNAQYEVDNQVQENCVKILYTFAVVCNAPFTQEEKLILRKFWDEQNNQVGNEKALAERWDFQVDELRALKMKLTTG
ncbi:hypothetical protein PILCRDRAFT_820934 [Piloderma croceum F 1598]|uniref:Nucleotide exchange factor Fes1 domain-containing protein n=1 Tax=Piloderma croceum (strain F 1598) TaxID=765440 RepID=A0A0C3FQN8_PILCF|nr:hypothetical protein PILCRDRAFT_820934 [Piloderma croceum F 1598]